MSHTSPLLHLPQPAANRQSTASTASIDIRLDFARPTSFHRLSRNLDDDVLESYYADDDVEQDPPPQHPIPAMQGAFEESIAESHDPQLVQSRNTLDAAARRVQLIELDEFTSEFSSRWQHRPLAQYHPLWKIVAQVSFGIHLLHRGLAKSEEDVISILQAHIQEVDGFIEDATADLDLALTDILDRKRLLAMPLGHTKTFERMLRDPNFRKSILDGNVAIKRILERTAKAMQCTLEDAARGMQAADQLHNYLDQVASDWPRYDQDLVGIHAAMVGNAQGWHRTFRDMERKGDDLIEAMDSLDEVCNEVRRRAVEAPRKALHSEHSTHSLKSARSPNPSMKSPTPGTPPLTDEPTTTKSRRVSQLDKPLPQPPAVPVGGRPTVTFAPMPESMQSSASHSRKVSVEKTAPETLDRQHPLRGNPLRPESLAAELERERLAREAAEHGYGRHSESQEQAQAGRDAVARSKTVAHDSRQHEAHRSASTVRPRRDASRGDSRHRESPRPDAGGQDHARQEAARQEAARQEAARQEAARQEAARQEAARQEAARREAALKEAALKEAARQKAAREEAARQEAARQEAARQEAARQEAARQGALREEAARQEAARQEALREEEARQEAARQEAARQEAARQEAARQEAARQEAARQEATRQEAAREEAAREQAAREEAAREEAAREECPARLQAGQQEASKSEPTKRIPSPIKRKTSPILPSLEEAPTPVDQQFEPDALATPAAETPSAEESQATQLEEDEAEPQSSIQKGSDAEANAGHEVEDESHDDDLAQDLPIMIDIALEDDSTSSHDAQEASILLDDQSTASSSHRSQHSRIDSPVLKVKIPSGNIAEQLPHLNQAPATKAGKRISTKIPQLALRPAAQALDVRTPDGSPSTSAGSTPVVVKAPSRVVWKAVAPASGQFRLVRGESPVPSIARRASPGGVSPASRSMLEPISASDVSDSNSIESRSHDAGELVDDDASAQAAPVESIAEEDEVALHVENAESAPAANDEQETQPTTAQPTIKLDGPVGDILIMAPVEIMEPATSETEAPVSGKPPVVDQHRAEPAAQTARVDPVKTTSIEPAKSEPWSSEGPEYQLPAGVQLSLSFASRSPPPALPSPSRISTYSDKQVFVHSDPMLEGATNRAILDSSPLQSPSLFGGSPSPSLRGSASLRGSESLRQSKYSDKELVVSYGSAPPAVEQSQSLQPRRTGYRTRSHDTLRKSPTPSAQSPNLAGSPASFSQAQRYPSGRSLLDYEEKQVVLPPPSRSASGPLMGVAAPTKQNSQSSTLSNSTLGTRGSEDSTHTAYPVPGYTKAGRHSPKVSTQSSNSREQPRVQIRPSTSGGPQNAPSRIRRSASVETATALPALPSTESSPVDTATHGLAPPDGKRLGAFRKPSLIGLRGVFSSKRAPSSQRKIVSGGLGGLSAI